ncbi:MAG: S41 family peptidase [Bryobacteraceae bacterium]
MRPILSALLILSSASGLFAELSASQKALDFQVLAGVYAKNYALYGWKRDVIGFDLFDLTPWLDRVAKSKGDLAFYEICAEYVASLNDVHSTFLLPSNFRADLGFRVDIYDGKILIDEIDREVLAADDFPAAIGDELVSVDGIPPAEIIKDASRFLAFGNARSTARYSAFSVTVRDQVVFPRAVEVGGTAAVVVRRQDGTLENYKLPWIKTGRPLFSNGSVPSPKSNGIRTAAANHFEPTTDPLALLDRHRVNHLLNLKGFGDPEPVFRMPSNFINRRNGVFFSGTFKSGALNIGFIRISDFEPAAQEDLSFIYPYFEREIKYFQANTDGLVIDVMRNPGGFGCYGENLLRRLIPYQFQSIGMAIRPTLNWLNLFYDELELEKDPQYGIPQWRIDLLGAYLKEMETANAENRGMTGPLPLCTYRFERDPATDADGNSIAYTKPAILLTDEFTTSAGDIFAALFQDAKRGPVVGWRTAGAGGSINEFSAGVYGEATASAATSMLLRRAPVVTSDFPASALIENVGVRPDVEIDYMTKDNLLRNGRSFVDSFTRAITDEIMKRQGK